MSTPKVYSYTRFSTPEQAKGDSARRQSDMAARWIAQHPGMELDTELNMSDLGVSGYSGKNLDNEAALGGFIRGIKDGVVLPGSVLLLEKFDRGTRLEPPDAIALLTKIIRAGVDIVTLTNGKRWDPTSLSSFEFIMMSAEVTLAHQESKGKGARVKEAKAASRAKVRANPSLSYTRWTPAWIARDGSKALIMKRAKIVKEIFTKFVAGTGKHSITAMLNDRREPVWSHGKRTPTCWHRSYVTKILGNPAVIGTFIPHSADGTAKASIEGYFPPVIDRELWDRAQAIIQSPRTRIVKDRVQNVLATLARCPLCRGAMTRVVKGNGSEPKLLCTTAKNTTTKPAKKTAATPGLAPWLGCTRHPVSMSAVQSALIKSAKSPWPSRTAGLDTAIREAEAAEEATLELIDNVVDLIARRPSKALEAKLAVLEAQRDKIQADLADLHKHAKASETRLLQKREARYRDALTATPFDAARANMVLRECLDHVVVDYGREMLRLKWKHNGETEISYEEFSDLGPVGKAPVKVGKKRAARKGK